MGEIIIRYNSRVLERIFYWVLIALLLILLILSYLHDGSCRKTAATVAGNTTINTTVARTTNTTGETNASVKKSVDVKKSGTCDDGVKNQDETDIDCGGRTCDPCPEGRSCERNIDCEEGVCKDGVCDATPQLSGKDVVDIKNVDYTQSSQERAKVTGVTVTVENGKNEGLAAKLQIWVKSADGVSYLNQPDGMEDTGEIVYGEITLPPLPAGSKITREVKDDEIAGSYLFSNNGAYQPGDDFTVEVKLVNEKTGTVVASDSYLVRV